MASATTSRPAEAADLPEVARLAAGMYRDLGAGAAPDGWEAAVVDAVRPRLGRDVGAFVADDPGAAGRLRAVALGLVEARVPSPSNPSGRVGYLQWLAVAPEHRRAGLARLLSEQMLAWFADRGAPVVDVHASPVAEGLYASLGFTSAGPRAMRLRRP